MIAHDRKSEVRSPLHAGGIKLTTATDRQLHVHSHASQAHIIYIYIYILCPGYPNDQITISTADTCALRFRPSSLA